MIFEVHCAYLKTMSSFINGIPEPWTEKNNKTKLSEIALLYCFFVLNYISVIKKQTNWTLHSILWQ